MERETPEIELLFGEEVLDRLSSAEIPDLWNTLVGACPWATTFQRFEFVNTWYNLYQKEYIPVLILESKKDRLTGIFPLALNKKKQLIAAGADQAEYQVWVYHTENCHYFLDRSLHLLWSKIHPSKITLKYLPEGSPMETFSQKHFWRKRSHIKTHRHPVLETFSEKPYVEIRKKNKREKLNRLKRQGDLQFSKITKIDEFTEILDELIIQSDFRKGAVYNHMIFKEDPLRKSFMLALFEKELLHVSTLRLNDEIIASNVGVVGKSWVHLQGINTHSPFYAKHSPGILHFLMLAQDLKAESIKIFDLTPGADTYKSSLASEFKKAFELTIQNPQKIHLDEWKNNFIVKAKKQLESMGFDEASLRKHKSNFLFIKNKWKHLLRQNPGIHLQRVYRDKTHFPNPKFFAINKQIPNGQSINIQKNNLGDLLKYEPNDEPLPMQAFLMDCMKKLEEGQECWTYVDKDKLQILAWFTVNPKNSSIPNDEIKLPLLNGIIQEFYLKNSANPPIKAFLNQLISLKNIDGKELLFYTKDKNIQKILMDLQVPI
ncbi:GNAT family N-acetyltransferase [Echinicola marina]|uniref:GNAT family N-acetyltransferase n=1 Tax=Echinicola marina TaxID=2859768 RepID=UPI001CF61940|nr:GNAT family N-acetyltransferase [Echinicola marina]UCS92970.1 GNAT family N-acetyltransferase [Echinicola marina]